eukprot:m.146783 g.146783  ORF g.146783 m.146783 type:complete len:351 (-) comp30499_c2_seq1:114-1166(-)
MEQKGETPPIEEKEYSPPPPRDPDVFCDVSTAWIGTMNLFNQLQFGSSLVLVDIRSKEAFDKSHLRSAINVPLGICQDSTFLDIEDDVLPARFRRRRNDNVFVYDEASTSTDKKDTAAFLQRLVDERLCTLTVCALEGGFQAFADRFPFLTTGDESFGDKHKEYPSMILDDFLFLGAWGAAKDRHVLDDLKIEYIVNATEQCGQPFEGDLKYIQCALDDKPGANIEQFFDPCLEFMEDAKANKGRVLIHCQMGMSRSSTLVILWIMVKYKMNMRDATSLVRKERPFINPNPGFLKQLGVYEEKLFGSTTIRFPDEPVTLRTIYEWLQDDGTWEKRVVVGYNDNSGDNTDE